MIRALYKRFKMCWLCVLLIKKKKMSKMQHVFFVDFYGKGAGYSILSAKDASYAIAKWSLEKKDMHHDLVSTCITILIPKWQQA